MKDNKIIVWICALCCILLSVSCKEEKRKIIFYDSTEYTSDSDVLIPFEEQGGVKLIDVTVNGQFTVKMILDSGCSGTLISIAEAKYLYEKGCFSSDDILGFSQAQIADGSIVENMVINLKELVIGNQITCPDVKATVSSNAEAPLLLGNEILNRVPSYSVDNENKVIKFQLR